MITPKEKATQLVSIIINQLPPEEAQYERIIAKNCALVAVNEVIWAFKQMGKGSRFYDEVKKEIELL